MKTVPLFDFVPLDNGHARTERVARSGHALFRVLSKGKAGLNPTTVWLDAAVATLDAFNSWQRYQQATEVTRQLRIQREALKTVLRNTEKTFGIEQATWKQALQQRQVRLERALQQDARAADRLLKDIKSRRKTVDVLLHELRTLRRNAGGDTPELRQLLHYTDQLLQAQLLCTVNAFDQKSTDV